MKFPWINTISFPDPNGGSLQACMLCNRCMAPISRPDYGGLCWRCYARFGPSAWVRMLLQGRRIGPWSDRLRPGGEGWKYSHCGRCKTNWAFVQGHTTDYSGGGCFPLCEQCWAELAPEDRLPYYRSLWEDWQASEYPTDEDRWGEIEHAVLTGK